ncbi:hypothetical protein MUG91_G215n1 [Manis pentadactyla]|nr:hypothetical protein MUG91_G215n1 [Manis pentadactyla]
MALQARAQEGPPALSITGGRGGGEASSRSRSPGESCARGQSSRRNGLTHGLRRLPLNRRLEVNIRGAHDLVNLHVMPLEPQKVHVTTDSSSREKAGRALKEGAEHSPRSRSERCQASPGGGAAFHEAAADKKLQGRGLLSSSSQGEGGTFSEKLGSELCQASLGGGAAFHQAAADKLQVEIFLDQISRVAWLLCWLQPCMCPPCNSFFQTTAYLLLE